MPLFLCRWPNGDCSVVWAANEEDAIVELDQVGNAEACPLVRLPVFQAHFVVTDHGDLSLEALGEGTRQQIVSRAYPILARALTAANDDGEDDSHDTLPPSRRAAVAAAVALERDRLAGDRPDPTEPDTALGRAVKKQTDVPTVLVDRIARHVATTKLKHFKGRGKPS